jgi:acyl carrier protein
VLVNHLAATEASVTAQYVVDHRSGPVTGILPVGRPPAGLRVAIRREDGQLAAVDEVGQIVVSSAHVSPGYWRRPKLNSAAFAADKNEPGVRHYFSGDLGRIDAEGELHFLGRSGNRVKIRGYSIDLAEVEAAVSAAPGVVKSVVLALGEPGQEPDRIAAYVVAGRGAPREAAALRRLLAASLPSYMLPGSFLFVEKLPVTATGKIDRRALETIALTQAEHRSVEPPRDETERIVAEIFQALLKQPVVGRNDDFFLLGGDSLSVVELQTRLRDAFKVGSPKILEEATVAGIAARIAAGKGQASTSASIPVLCALRERGGAPPLFLVHGRLGQALVSPRLLQLLGDDQPVWAFQARGLDGLHPPHPTIEAMAADYLAEMRRQRPEGPYFIGSLCAGAFIAVEMARALRAANDVVLPLLLLDPPEQAFAMTDATMTEKSLMSRLKRRHAMGSIDAPIDDPVYARSSVRVARAFEQAIRRYQGAPYDGPVFMFSSSSRISADQSWLTQRYSGRVERFEVATTHSEILDAHNPLFARHLAYCVNEIREAAKADRPHAAHYAQR